jgi:ribosomal protein S18 acetylase RimI-like enzyme
MIDFSTMTEEQYSAFLAYFIPDYAEEIASNYARSINDALKQAETEIAHSLPDGPQTKGHSLRNIIDSNLQVVIGYVWYRPDEATRSVFIFDFSILPEHRAKGQGKAALRALETMLAAEGYSEIKLRVAADNPRAQHVYQAGGFRITGINMAKQIQSSPDD